MTETQMRLPIELITLVGSQLEHTTLLSLSLTSKLVFKALKTVLELEKNVRQNYRNIVVQSDIGGLYPFHRLLERLAHDDRLPTYVVSLDCTEYIHIGDEGSCYLSVKERKQRAEHLSRFSETSQALLRKELDQMVRISEPQCTRLLERIFTMGCESAVLAVLLCIMVELRLLCPPYDWGNDVQELIQSITCNFHLQTSQPVRDASTKAVSKPLSKLLMIRGAASNGVHGVDLYKALVWMDLPSVKRVVLPACRTDEFSKGAVPPAMLGLRTPDIYLCESSVTVEAITEFAKFLRGPCMIRQTLGFAGEYYEGTGLEWDHCEIIESQFNDSGGVGSSTKTVNIEIRYPASELHDFSDMGDFAAIDSAETPESPLWKSMGEGDRGEVSDWTKIQL